MAPGPRTRADIQRLLGVTSGTLTQYLGSSKGTLHRAPRTLTDSSDSAVTIEKLAKALDVEGWPCKPSQLLN